MGMLRVNGSIRVDQVWPGGPKDKADADTLDVKVDIDPDRAFQYQESGAAGFRATAVFDGAEVVIPNQKNSPVVKEGLVRVRLQGIDAPELHMGVRDLRSDESLDEDRRKQFAAYHWKGFRQNWSQSSAHALRVYLKSFGKDELPCQVISVVDKPNEVFDVYGRMIGDILVPVAGQMQSINQWLVREGWAYPSFYNSMSEGEIDAILVAWAQGKGRNAGSSLATRIGALDFKMRYEDGFSGFQSKSDTGVVLYPKLFRRLVNWTVCKRFGLGPESKSATAIEFFRQDSTEWVALADYRKNPSLSVKHKLGELVTDAGGVTLDPTDVVFVENEGSKLVKNGQDVLRWF